MAQTITRGADVFIVEALLHPMRRCARCDLELQPRSADRNCRIAVKQYCSELCRKRAERARWYERRRLTRQLPKDTILELSCKKCGQTFEGKHQRGRRPDYCSEKCRKRPVHRPKYAARTPRVVEYHCSECQVTASYLKASSGRDRKFCSVACRSNYHCRTSHRRRVRAKRPRPHQ